MTQMITFEQKQNPAYIKVLGVGGGGSNAVNHMFIQGITGVDFVVCNTDVQALESSPVPIKIVLGDRELGAGSKPEVGRAAAEASVEAIREAIKDHTQMLFVTAGMGGGTGTGAAPIIAQLAREMGILTVGIVTLPFSFEGRRRMKQAQEGIEEMRKHVDTLLTISNDKLRLLYGDVTLSNAFGHADDILTSAAKGIAELITVPGYVNIDFEDVKTVIENSGKAIMGSAVAEGDDRARRAIDEAMSSPLLNDNDIKGARNILLYIMTGNDEITMDEITEITDHVHEECGGDFDADVIWGTGVDEKLGNNIGITIIATGFDAKTDKTPSKKRIGTLGDNPSREAKKEDKEEKEEKSGIVFESVRDNKDEKKSDDNEEHDELKLIRREEKAEIKKELTQTPPPEKKVVHTLGEEKTKEEPVAERKEDTFHLFNATENPRLSIQKTISSNTFYMPKEVKPEKAAPIEDDIIDKKSADRSKKLRELSMLRQEGVEDMEKEPAYMRKNYEPDNSTPSTDSEISKYTLGEDSKNNPTIKSDNSFLHDNVD